MHIKNRFKEAKTVRLVICGFLIASMIAVIYSGMLSHTYFIKYKDIKIGNINGYNSPNNEIIKLDNQVNLLSVENVPVVENTEIIKGVTYGIKEDKLNVDKIIKADNDIDKGYGIKNGDKYIVWTKDKENLENYINNFGSFICSNYPESDISVSNICSIESCICTDDNLIDYNELASALEISLDKTVYSENIIEKDPEITYVYGSENKQLKKGSKTVIKEIYEINIHNGVELSTNKISEEIVSEGEKSVFMTTDKSKLTYDYTATALNLNSIQTDFINTILPTLIEGQEKYHIPVSLGLGQAILESGWGIHHTNNNIYGIKGISGYKSYSSFIECAEDYVNILSTRKYYKKVLTSTNYIEACQYIGESGYAGSPNYGEKVRNIIEKYGLYRWDNL